MRNTFYSSLFFLSFVLEALFVVLPNVNGNILDDICPGSFFPPLCFQMLQNDPSVSKGDAHGLLSTVLQIAQDNSTSTYKWVKSIIKKPIKDPNLKAHMTNCLRNYNDATNYLKQSNYLYNTSAYKNTSLYLSLVMFESLSCNREFNEVPANLKPLSESVQEFSNLSARIADNLK